MNALTHHELIVFLLSLGVILSFARTLAEIAKRFKQPMVVGEIIAGIILGPTILGVLSPSLQSFLFPKDGGVAAALNTLITLSIIFFLLVAGMEINLSALWRQRRTALMVGVGGIAFPFLLGFCFAWFKPNMLGAGFDGNNLIFSLFFGTALSISALPVIVRILLDLKLYHSDVGMVIVSAAIFCDLVGWTLFAIIMSLTSGAQSQNFGVGLTIILTLGFVIFTVFIGKWLLDRFLPWIQAYASWPAGVLGLAVSGALFCAAFAEFIGIHAILGSFIFGIALGNSMHLREKTRDILSKFITSIFAPIFFGSIGLKMNFLMNFNLRLVVIVFLLSAAGKYAGGVIGARLGGFTSREAWAIGTGINTHGAMEVILALLALQTRIIHEDMFVAIVTMVLITSTINGALIQRILGRKKPVRFIQFLSPGAFSESLDAKEKFQAIRELAEMACENTGLEPDMVTSIVLANEKTIPSTISNGIVILYADFDSLNGSIVAAGISRNGVIFDPRDNHKVKIIFLVITPKLDEYVKREITADINETFRSPEFAEIARQASSFTEFLALIKSRKGFEK